MNVRLSQYVVALEAASRHTLAPVARAAHKWAKCRVQRDTAAEAMLITATADPRQEIVLHVTFRPLPLPARSHFSMLAVGSQSVAGAAK